MKKVSEEIPDLIILDIRLPKMNGYEVIGRLKEDQKTRGIPIILLTAHKDDIKYGSEILPGGIPVLTKTEGLEELVKLVHRIA